MSQECEGGAGTPMVRKDGPQSWAEAGAAGGPRMRAEDDSARLTLSSKLKGREWVVMQ